jgi:hypothetical protein
MKSALSTFLLWCTLSSLFPLVALPQDFSSINRDLAELERLIQDTLANSKAQMKQLDNLQRNLAGSGELIRSYEHVIQERESLLKGLQARLKNPLMHG